MEQEYAPDGILAPATDLPVRGATGKAVLALLVLLGFAMLALYLQRPPDAVPAAGAPPTEFSSGRAMTQLSSISEKPHPIGSAEHAAVREYLVGQLGALGLRPEVQRAEVIDSRWMNVGVVNNIVAVLPGTGGGQGILLVSHYDTVPHAQGASDDGAGVVTVLETLRALKAGPPLKNDVVALFTDGEEIGSMGARAFADGHPLAKGARLALNFEARGNGGPALMFETSDRNRWLIDEFAKAAPRPVANSLFYEIYRALPNDTDLSVFKRAGVAGMNFAHVAGHTHYHSRLDSVAQLDERSLQHQGTLAVALTRHFGGLDLNQTSDANSVYFDVAGRGLVRYSAAWVWPLTLVALALFAFLTLAARRRGLLTLRGTAFGFVALLLTFIVSVLVVSLAWAGIGMVHRQYGQIPQGVTYNGHYYLIAFVGLVVALGSLFYNLFRRRTSLHSLTAGALLWWALLLILTSLSLPGASFLFLWPLLFGLAAWAVLLYGARGEAAPPAGLQALFYLCAAPGVLFVVPLIQLLYVAMPADAVGSLMIFVVFLFGLLLPHLQQVAGWSRRLLPAAGALTFVVFAVLGSLTAGFSAERPKPNNLFYALDADAGQAIWGSTDRATDEWTGQFFRDGANRGGVAGYLITRREDFLSAKASAVALPAPSAEVLSDSTANGERTLRLRLKSARQAPAMQIEVETDEPLKEALVNGRKIEEPDARPAQGGQQQQGAWGFEYYAPPPEGIELSLTLPAGRGLKVRIVDRSFELPAGPGLSYSRRPDYMIPTPFPYDPYGDSTFVHKSFTF